MTDDQLAHDRKIRQIYIDIGEIGIAPCKIIFHLEAYVAIEQPGQEQTGATKLDGVLRISKISFQVLVLTEPRPIIVNSAAQPQRKTTIVRFQVHPILPVGTDVFGF